MVTSDPEHRREHQLTRLYNRRFRGEELVDKRVLWSTLCEHFLQQYIDPESTVLDLGAGRCEFINNIRAKRKLAVDPNPATRGLADPEVEVFEIFSNELEPIFDADVDIVFASNFFEHVADKDVLIETLNECHRITRPGGRIIVLMPNVRYVPGRFWDYLDHHVPLTHVSLVEALELTGFEPEVVVPRFLPYTIKASRLPVRTELIRLYLRLPFLWPVFGRQMFVVARRSPQLTG
jgi:SAM-dependent methyltransferase